jgi:2-polyprenyl-3-methyl-5-hydroxy-6-metoxy-1,4-benzoquinol methylase
MSTKQQSKEEIELSYARNDPWGYFRNPHDDMRKKILMATLAEYSLSRVLDVGCGNGFITQSIPAASIVGVDISQSAVDEARARSTGSIDFRCSSLFDLPQQKLGSFDCVLITGVLYDHYIGKSLPLVYRIVDDYLSAGGILVSVHIEEWYFAKFPYAGIKRHRYRYREYTHLLEVYRK